MKNLLILDNSAVMFIKCDSDISSICHIPELFCENYSTNYNDKFKLECIKTSEPVNLDLNNIASFYKHADKITLNNFMEYNSKTIIFTVDLQIEDMINLQYILVLTSFLQTRNINYFLILNTDGHNDTYYKIYHYFYGKYEPIYNNVYVRSGKERLKALPQVNTIYYPGEIFPYFNIDFEFYKTSFKSFSFKSDIMVEHTNEPKNFVIEDVLKKHYYDVSKTEIFLLRYIYSFLLKSTKEKSNKIIDFLKTRPDSPLFSIVLFVAIASKTNIENLSHLYEQCLDYALSMEQLIENSMFYAGNGVLSIRIHKATSITMRKICSSKNKFSFLLEISLIDFQKDIQKHSIKYHFIKNACVSEEERRLLLAELSKTDNLSDLFFQNDSPILNDYLKKPEVILQHYGLQTIGLLAKKTNSFLFVKSGNDYVTNLSNNIFFKQTKEQYPYGVGTLYRIIIPIQERIYPYTYSGLNSNNYGSSDINIKSINFDMFKDITNIPKNRNEKRILIQRCQDQLEKAYEREKILAINIQSINNRMHLEYVVKASMGLLYDRSTPKYIALVGIKNKTFLKIALRFIILSYNRDGKNSIFEKSELFLCTDDCKTEVLISGNDLNNILENISSQRIFGTIDDDLFEEIIIAFKAIKEG